MDDLTAVQWHDGKVRILDQTQLPHELVLLEMSDYKNVINAIKNMNVRGAPVIGITAAFGVALALWDADEMDRPGFLERANSAIEEFKQARPTAKNLSWALERVRMAMTRNLSKPLSKVKQALVDEAQKIKDEDKENCQKIGRYGAELLPNRPQVLTHCHAGALATGGYGTALGVVRGAVEMGKKVHVYVDETRPLLQGARLTAFELLEDDIPMTLICDNMAANLMKQGKVDAVVVGADRIARNGDVANKIGTYSLAVLASYHNIPFYVAAPASTFDLDAASGKDIIIEERDSDEVRRFKDVSVAPEDAPVWNPAFDVTPNELIAAIVTERGVLRAPLNDSITQKFIDSK
jgi:methylthioribose-1-phosphate isomerase